MDLSADMGDQEQWQPVIARWNATPFYQLLGMRIEAMGNGSARLTLPIDNKLFQLYGTVHGGATASLADSAVGVALVSLLGEGEKSITIELKLNFVSTATRGTLTAEARLFQRGRRIAAGEVEIRNDDGKLIAKGISTLVPLKS